MPITPEPFDKEARDGALTISDATVYCGSRLEADVVAQRFGEQIDWPKGCEWPRLPYEGEPDEARDAALRFAIRSLNRAGHTWNLAVVTYSQAGGSDDQMIQRAAEQLFTELRHVPDLFHRSAD